MSENINKNKVFGIRTQGLEKELEEIISNHVKDKLEYTFLEIGVATALSHRAIRDIISENIKTNDYLTLGLDILNSPDVNFDKINKIFTPDELLINNKQGDEDFLNKLESGEYHSILVLRENPREWIKNITDNELDLVWIDSCHCYDCCKGDFLAIEHKVKSGALIIFHDATIDCQDTDTQIHGGGIAVRKAIEDLSLLYNKRPGFELVKEIFGTRTTLGDSNGGNGAIIVKKI